MLVNIFDGVWNSGYLMSGGRNLALETNQNATNWDWVMKTGGASLTENIENDVKIVKFVRDTTEMTEWSVLYYKNLALQQFEPDTYYTISVDINPSVDTTFRCCIVKLNATSVSYSVAKQGSTGATGTTGSQWYAGTGITGTSTTATAFADSGVANARVNDMYLNTSTGNTYKCTVAGNATNAKWIYAGNIKGVQGDKGNTGATGNGISKADITYASSSSNTSAPTSGWQSTPPSVSPGQYLWTKTVFTYTNGGTATQYSVAKQGNTGAAGADAITVSITSSNGTVFKNNSGSTVLTAHVYKGAVEQTVADNGTVSGLGTIKWYKVGSDTAVATAKTLTVSANDVDNTQAYTCQLEG